MRLRAHVALYCDELAMLISGDMLLPCIATSVSVWPMQPDGNPRDDFLASLDALRRLPSNILVLPSHGLPFRGLHERIADFHHHHSRRFETIPAVCEQATTAAQLLPLLSKHKLDGYQLFFAMGETIAHLNSLAPRGVLKRVQGPDGIFRLARGAEIANCAGMI